MAGAHSLSEHIERLNSLCRLCGENVKRKGAKDKRANVKLCVNYADPLQRYRDINIATDEEGKHPTGMCQKCYFRLMDCTKKKFESMENGNCHNAAEKIKKSSVLWTQYKPNVLLDQCSTCSHYERISKGGRPQKPNKRAPERFYHTIEIEPADDGDTDVTSPSPSDTPLTSTPKKSKHQDSQVCSAVVMPSTPSPLKVTSVVGIQTSPSLILPSLPKTPQEASPFKTPRKRDRKDVQLQTSPCLQQHSSVSPQKKRKMQNVNLQTSPENKKPTSRPWDEIITPLTKIEEKSFTQMARIKLKESGGSSVKCLTGGQNIVLTRTVQSRVCSTKASKRTIQARRKNVRSYRADISGSSTNDSMIQQASEIKTLPGREQQKLLHQAGCSTSVPISPRKSVALKNQLGLSNYKHNQQKKLLRKYGVQFPSKSEEKKQRKDALFGDIVIERTNLSFVDENDKTTFIKETPIGKVTNLTQMVQRLLDQYDKHNQLDEKWADGSIPEDEVWVKIGGDHGGGSFKLMLQVANVPNANSRNNTCVIAVVNCKDTPQNLKQILDPYKQQITELKKMQWHNKKMKLFLFGDYDFLLKLYGIGGAQATHPCLFCTATKSQIQTPKHFNDRNIPQRSLKQLERDYRRYRNSKKKVAKLHNNVIRRPMMNIEVDQVAPPYLHILLGIVKKHHTLMEKECHSIDQKIAGMFIRDKRTADEGRQAFNDFIRENENREEISQLEEESRDIEIELSCNEWYQDQPDKYQRRTNKYKELYN